MLKKIISGGQTGVDQAALDAAIQLDIPYGGKCPKGRIAENGKIPERFINLEEVSGEFSKEKDNYDARTKANIAESDATLILVPVIPLPKNIKDGTLLTIDEVKRQRKPYLVIDLSKNNADIVINWIKENCIEVLNIAGPRESNSKGVNELSYKFLLMILPQLKCGNEIRCRL